MNANFEFDADVIISGLGPTGLTLANVLGKRGVKVIVLEREPEYYGNARAVYTDDECMRIFQSFGLADELEKEMLMAIPFQFLLEDGSTLGQYYPQRKPFGWSIGNLFYQPYLETSLMNGLDRFDNVEVRRGCEMTDFVQDDNSVEVSYIKSSGTAYGAENSKAQTDQQDAESIKAKYFVACDGGRSETRAKLGIEMSGKSFPEPWLVVDIKVNEGEDCLHHIPYFTFYCTPECPTVSCPQPDGHHRFEFMLTKGQTKEYMEDPATVRKLISRYVDPDKVTVLRRLVYTFNALMADDWREKRVFLAGDAAHMTPQFIGQGMNSGVRDAYNIGWKLAHVIQGKADASLLDSYQSERKDNAQSMINIAIMMKNMVSLKNPVLASIRNVLGKAFLKFNVFQNLMQKMRFKASSSFIPGKYLGQQRKGLRGVEGRLMPQPVIRATNGRQPLFDDISGDEYCLIGLGQDPRLDLSASNIEKLEALGTKFIAVYDYADRPQAKPGVPTANPAGLIEVEDMSTTFIKWFKRSGRSTKVALVRPDNYVFATAKQNTSNALVDDFLQKLGEPDLTSIEKQHEVDPLRKSA